jgi:hypothetical protein
MSLVIRASKTNRKDAFAKRLVGVASRREEKYTKEERKEEKLTMSLPIKINDMNYELFLSLSPPDLITTHLNQQFWRGENANAHQAGF